jgi:hypothetical protein
MERSAKSVINMGLDDDNPLIRAMRDDHINQIGLETDEGLRCGPECR